MTCRRCGADITKGSMKGHLETVHGVRESVFRCPTVGKVGIEVISVRLKGDMKYTSCSVDGCRGEAYDILWNVPKFCVYISFDNTESGWKNLGGCALCGMQTANSDRNWKSDTCKKLKFRRDNEKAAMKQWEAERVEFTINGVKIERVKEFRDLRRVPTEDDNNSRCIKDKLKRSRRR